MHAVMNGVRSRSTLLTGAAGLLLLVTAIVMMVWAAPRIHAVRTTSSRLAATQSRVTSPRDQLAAWVWVSRGNWIRVTPAPAGGLIRGGHALTP